MARKDGRSIVGARRNTVAAAIRARGQSPHNIWIIRPPFDSADVHLNSDVAMELFYYVEGEPTLIEIDYHDLRTPAGTKPERSIIATTFAHATTLARTELDVVFVEEHAGDSGISGDGIVARYEVTLEMLDAGAQRIENWRRIIPCIRRTHRHPTATLERRILLNWRSGSTRTIREVLGAHSGEDTALAIGAIAKLLRRRELVGDLDKRPWSLNTLLWCEP